MATSKFLWKVWLKSNLLTKDVENDYIAEVSTIGNTKRNEDIAKIIIEEGSEIKYDTLLSILNQSDRIKRRILQSGSSVQDGLARFSPKIRGRWLGSSAKFDPDVNKATLYVNPCAEMRDALKLVDVEVLGIKSSGAFIGLVTNAADGTTNGTITINEDVVIEGDKIKILPDNDPELGVFFVDKDGLEFRVERRLIQNKPKKIVVRVPENLNFGEFTLRVKTRYSHGQQLLKEARIIDSEQTLIVS